MHFPGKRITRREILLDRDFREEDIKGEEWKVSVNYADELKKIMVPVQARFGLFGVMENRNIQQEGNGDENARHDK